MKGKLKFSLSFPSHSFIVFHNSFFFNHQNDILQMHSIQIYFMFSKHLTEVIKLKLLVASTVSHKRYIPPSEIKIIIALNSVMHELYNNIHINLTIFGLVF